MKNKLVALMASLFLLTSALTGCSSPKEDAAPKKETPQEVILATTTSTQDSGLLDALIPVFEKENNMKVKVVAVGTGQAIQLGKDGNADVLLVHSRSAENDFVKEGYGDLAYDLMYNQYYIVGPKGDPANMKETHTAVEALTKMAAEKSTFVSRGDDSGTHKKELAIWKTANITPTGDWYVSAGQGMGDTLRMAEELGGYTLTDEATFLSNKTTLEPVLTGDKDLLNPYGIIRVKSTQSKEAADKLINFFISTDAQDIIKEFGTDTYGKGLFVPEVKERK